MSDNNQDKLTPEDTPEQIQPAAPASLSVEPAAQGSPPPVEPIAPDSRTENVTLKRSTYKKLVIGIVISLIAVSFFGGYILDQSTNKSVALENITPTQTVPQTNPQPTSNPNQPNTKIFVSYHDSPMKGNQNAPVTIVEFSDFQCPFCERFFSQTLPQLEQNYLDSGKARLVYRDFPLESIHPNAVAASLAAQCANEQGKFWQYHDMLFGNQDQWANLDSGNTTTTFKQYAVQLDLNSNNFNTCLDSSKYLGVVQKNFQDGTMHSVSGTPTFFIGDDKDGYVQLVGAQPYSVFQQTIDQELH